MTRQAAPADRMSFFPFTRGLIHARDRRLSRLAPGPEGPARLLAEADTSVWAMVHTITLPELRELARVRPRPPARGAELRVVLHPVGLARCPMASSVVPALRRGPAAQPLAVVDGRLVVLRDPVGDAWWVTSDPELVARGAQTLETVWSAADPVLAPGEPPPFTERMVRVALLLLRGATDRQVARELRVSERTVSAEVRELTRRLGATSRAHAIARISGV